MCSSQFNNITDPRREKTVLRNEELKRQKRKVLYYNIMAAVPWTSVLAYKTHMDRQGPSSDTKVASPPTKVPTEYTAILIECSKATPIK